jgi:hypothetical protein
MRFSDFLDPESGPEALVRFARYPLLILVIGSVAVALLSQLDIEEFSLALLLLVIASPLAYLIRERRRGRGWEPQARRGAERTPALPQHQEDE